MVKIKAIGASNNEQYRQEPTGRTQINQLSKRKLPHLQFLPLFASGDAEPLEVHERLPSCIKLIRLTSGPAQLILI